MLTLIRQELHQRQYRVLLAVLFAFFLSLYVFLDFEGAISYRVMTAEFGALVTSTHILINVIIAGLTSVMVTFSIINYKLTNIEPTGSNAIPFLSFLLGVLTFGCTSCVVAFLGAVGIAFTPLVLPNANLLWKIAALLFVALGFIWIMYTIQNSKCKIKR